MELIFAIIGIAGFAALIATFVVAMNRTVTDFSSIRIKPCPVREGLLYAGWRDGRAGELDDDSVIAPNAHRMQAGGRWDSDEDASESIVDSSGSISDSSNTDDYIDYAYFLDII